jgi:hypothetical protein
MPKYIQGKFTPKNPQKYVGDVKNIVYRSSWERKLLEFLDNTPSILYYGSEEVVIPYISPLDDKPHRYFTDFVVQYRTKSGAIKKAIVEVKPEAQTQQPVQKNQNKKRYLTEVSTYLVNSAKWNAAKAWCDKNGFDFLILTEKHLGIKK